MDPKAKDSEEKESRIIINAERIGLHKDATTAQMMERIYQLGDQNKELADALQRATLVAEKRAQSEKDMKALQAKTFVENAVRNQWIDKVEEKYFIEDYISDPVRTEERINVRKYRAILSKEHGLTLAGDPVDLEAEIEGRAREMMAKDKSLTIATAKVKVLSESERRNDGLWTRYRAKNTANGGSER